MTATSEYSVYSVEQLNPIKKLVAKSGISLSAIVRVANGVVRPVAQRVLERKVVLPSAITLTDKERRALTLLPARLQVQWPTERRLLNEEEKLDLLQLLDAVKDVKKLIDRTETSLSAAFGNHLDIQAEAFNGTDKAVIDDTTEISEKTGQYVLPGKVGHPDVEIVASREVRSGSTTLTDDGLQRMEELGLIDHDTYLRWTKPVRVPREAYILEDIANNPWHALALTEVTERGSGSTSLYRRAAK